MRKDVRLGLAVGVVLVAVLIVYLIVVPGGKQPSGVAVKDPVRANDARPDAINPDVADRRGGTEVVAAPTTAPVDRNAGTGSGGAERTGEVAATDTRAGESRATEIAGAWNWTDALMQGRPVPAVAVTETPTPDRMSRGGEVAVVDPIRITPPVPDTTLRAVDTGTAASPATRPAGQRTHRVQSGENFWSIARAAYGDSRLAGHLLKANPGIEPTKLRPNMTIVIPEITPDAVSAVPGGGVAAAPSTRPAPAAIDPNKEYRVQTGDNLYAISTRLYGRGDKAGRIHDLNKALIGADPARLRVGTVLQLPEPPAKR